MVQAIPSYALYGEGQGVDGQGGQGAGGFAHIETIAERSSLHDWEIGVHRHDRFVQVLLVEEGHAAITLDGRVSGLEGPGRVIVPEGAVHGFRFRQGTRGFVLTLSTDFSTRAHGGADPLLAELARGGVAQLSADGARRAFWLAREMLGLQHEWQEGDPLFLSLAEALIRAVAREIPAPDEDARSDRRLERFRQLVELHYRQHRDLDFYAHAMGMTRRTLSRMTAGGLGCSPLEVIHRRRALEAQRLLRYTNATAAQVAAELGFEDPSYFSRFYQRMTGRRPSQDKAGPEGAGQDATAHDKGAG